MASNISICISIHDLDLADAVSRLCAAQGWSVLSQQHPADCIIFDQLSDLGAIRELLKQSPQQHALYLSISGSSGSINDLGLPARCHVLAQDLLERDLVTAITTTLNVARFETQFFQTQHAEPITKLPHHAELLDYAQRFIGSAMGLVVTEIDHAEHLYANLDPVSKTDLLSALSEHLLSCLPQNAKMGIYDAASFAIWCPGMSLQETGALAQQVSQRSKQAMLFRGGQLHYSLSVGVAQEPMLVSPQDLWQQTWAAKEQAKVSGGNQVIHASKEDTLSERIPDALNREEFGLVVQPQWTIQGTELRGVEALLRWQGMEVGNIAPDRFIPIAERNGQMARVGDWVLEQAATAASTWLEAWVSPLLVGLNVSTQQFHNEALLGQIERLNKESWLDASILEMEMPHEKLLQVVDQNRTTLFKLRDMGVRIAIDNLGTGLVDTNKLLRCPADTLKIDRNLIAKIEHDDAARQLVAQICQVGQRFALRVVAVGVETEGQRALLENLGCTDAQGFLFSQPISLDEFGRYLRNLDISKNNTSSIAQRK